MTDRNGKPNPRCIVLPLLPAQGQPFSGIGIAVHFLLGNVIALHSGFREFWFGWRVGKIFSDENALKSFCRDLGPPFDPVKLGREQEIRLWLKGRVRKPGRIPEFELTLVDIESEREDQSIVLKLDFESKLIAFRKGFIRWLGKCGFPFPENQMEKVLWPEGASTAGLDCLGRAQEAFYIYSAWGKSVLDLELFETAVRAMPESYMAHNLKAWAHYRYNDYRSARKSFQRAMEINPHGVGAMGGLIWCAVYTGDSETAYSWTDVKSELLGQNKAAAKEKTARLIEKYSNR
ncbi:MAG: hypothetical protein H8D61_02135 [Deltaproteobacteria bacterium]|nr:hypothetical protein [Deltaproteobacteria bacterium]